MCGDVLGKLLKYIKPYILMMSLGFVIKFAATILDLVIPWVLAYMIDEIAPLKDMNKILFWGAVMAVSAIAALGSNIGANTMAAKVSSKITRKIRHDLFSKTMNLSSRQIDMFTIPSLVSRLSSDTYITHRMLGMMQRIGVRAPLLLIGGIIITMIIDIHLSLVLISILPFIAFFVYLISAKGIPLFGKLQKSVDRLVNVVRENITGIRVIKALSKGDHEKERFTQFNQGSALREIKARTTMAATQPLMNFLINLGLVLVIIAGAFRINAGISKPGVIIAFMTYFVLILNSMLNITRIFVMYSKGYASFNRINEVLESPDEIITGPEDIIQSDHHISFDRVSFSYNKKEPDLQDITFYIGHGQTLGIIGDTGSGKSSIIKLLMRLYDVDEGSIRIDGRNIKSFRKEELYPKFGTVFQGDVLFADTIAGNIDLDRELDHDMIERSTFLAQADEFVNSLDELHEHRLTSKGSNISGGQKQRILISRAIAGDPEILILDDSSSALDYKTEYELRKALNKEMSKTTTIIIAQRISSVMNADKILVVDDGRSIGLGSHAELMTSCEVYKDMYNIQLGVN